MPRRTVVAGRRAHPVAFDAPRRRGDLHQSIVIGQLVDELTGEPVLRRPRVTTDLAGARPKTAANGVAGLAGVPSRLLPELAALAYDVEVGFEVDGFVPFRHNVTVPHQPGFPAAFVDVDLGPVELRRLPVTLLVRTMELDAQNRPVALPTATVIVSGIWRTLAGLSGAPAPAALVSVAPAVYATRPSAGTTLAPVTMPPVAEPERMVVRAVEPGARRLEVSRRGGVAAGAVVGIDRHDTDRAEYVPVLQVEGPSDAESPTTLLLAFPVGRGHREGATVRQVTPTPMGGPPAGLTDGAEPGDATAFVTSTAPFAGAPIVRVSGGAVPDEFVIARTYRAVSDGDGYAWLPPLTRVAAVEVAASAAGPVAVPAAPFTLHYGAFENHLGLTLE